MSRIHRKSSKFSLRKVLILVILFIAMITAMRLMWYSYFSIPASPQPEQGELDLSQWEFIHEHSLKLDGEWEFYPKAWLYSDDSSNLIELEEEDKKFILVPGDWNSYMEEGGYGYGTYRLNVKVDPDGRRGFGIHIPSLNSSSEVYMNGVLQHKAGLPAANKEEYIPGNVPYSIFYELEEGEAELEIVIQAANFDHPLSGGLVRSVQFGYIETLLQDKNFARNVVTVSCIVYLLHAIYSVVIYFIAFRDTRLLYFALLVGVAVLGSFVTEDRLWYSWVDLGFSWNIKLVYLALIIGGFSVFQCTKHHLPKGLTQNLTRVYSSICFLAALMILVFPVSFNFKMEFLYVLLMSFPCLIAPIAIFRNISRVNTDNIFLLLAVLSAFISLAWLVVSEKNQLPTLSYPIDLMIAMVCFSAYWFRQYFRLYTETKQLSIQLQKEDRDKDEFLARVAHEMKNPLHSIMAISETVAERDKKNLHQQSSQDLELLNKVGRRMSGLVEDLTDLARLKEKRISLYWSDISVQAAAETVMDMLKFLVEDKPVQFINEIPKDLPFARADENRVIQIFFNLLHNAVLHSGGNEIRVQAKHRENFIIVSVKDNGKGLEPQVMKYIFDPYRRGTVEDVETSSGLGLGLSIVKQLVELHGGTIQVNSTPKQGTEFIFSLSAVQEGSSAALAEKTEAPVHRKTTAAKLLAEDKSLLSKAISITRSEIESGIGIGSEPGNHAVNHGDTDNTDIDNTDNTDMLRILIVDDDSINLLVLKSLLQDSVTEIITVNSGTEALNILDNEDWDLVITDVMMPVMSGMELTRLIRQQFSLYELPVLLLTARTREEDIEAGFHAGANDYVTKPISATELKSRVKLLTQWKRAVAERLRLEAAWLQAQIKPHFIINTFTAIAELGRSNLGRMEVLMEELSTYLRLSITFQNYNEVISLERELQLVRSYVNIMKERFSERMNVIWEVQAPLDIYIPPLSIQPLVENAISHGLAYLSRQGEIRIRIMDLGELVHVSVADNGVGMDKEKVESLFKVKQQSLSGIGLTNTNQRLLLTYGSGLKVDSAPDQGTTVSFTFSKTLVNPSQES